MANRLSTEAAEAAQTSNSGPPGTGSRCVAARYDLLASIGRGGLGSVYRARDRVDGGLVALKILEPRHSDAGQRHAEECFEQEFRALAQLAHPRVVRVYDFGREGNQPYYTMELLDGGDLRQLAPLPWQDVCRLAYEICSALSLLHSRRLLHLDITPRNIRRTNAGEAKLIDFGLLSPMGPPSLLAGTPPYVAPELVAASSLDGRTDLFSLGATLYHALTGRVAYPAKELRQLQDAWRTAPSAPSNFVSGLPPVLDELVLSMMRLDVGARPKSAAEVMERLARFVDPSLASLRGVSHAYLSTPALAGRDAQVRRLKKRALAAVRSQGGGFLVTGPAGVGRTRMLDAFVLETRLMGMTSLRASARETGRAPFSVASVLASRLHDAYPEDSAAVVRSEEACAQLFQTSETDGALHLVNLSDPTRERGPLQAALRSWFLGMAHRRPISVAVDDLHLVDEASAALLATLATDAKGNRVAYAATVDTSAGTGATGVVDVLMGHAEILELQPLDKEQLRQLLGSLFGDVSHLELLAARLFALSGGRPRECIWLATHLVDTGVLSYVGGSWHLPSAWTTICCPRAWSRCSSAG